jgi:hypothetical protein
VLLAPLLLFQPHFPPEHHKVQHSKNSEHALPSAVHWFAAGTAALVTPLVVAPPPVVAGGVPHLPEMQLLLQHSASAAHVPPLLLHCATAAALHKPLAQLPLQQSLDC